MRKMKAYKLGSKNSDNGFTVLIDFSMGDKIESHRYYLIFVNDLDIDLKRVHSIDSLVEYVGRNNMLLKQLNGEEVKNIFGIIQRYLELKEMYYLKNDKYSDVLDYPGVSNLIDYDQELLNNFFYATDYKSGKENGGGTNGKVG